MNGSEVDEGAISQRRLCSTCVREPFLRKQIEQDGKKARCSYCDDEEVKTISMGEMADRIDRAFEKHFELTPDEPSAFEYTAMKESDYQWYREGEPAVDAIERVADIPYDAAEDVRLILYERHYDFERDQMGEETSSQRTSANRHNLCAIGARHHLGCRSPQGKTGHRR